jgi:hypothetical protein
MSDVAISWSIEGPVDRLTDAARVASIDQNAINHGKIDADLAYPSFFCTSRSAWLKALAYLYVRNIQIRLFLIGTTESGKERWRYRILPGMDPEMLSLMREIDAAEADQLEALQHSMGVITNRLRATHLDDDLFE